MNIINKTQLVSFLLLLMCFAQKAEGQIVFGFRAGLNYAMFYTDKWKPLNEEDYGNYQLIKNEYKQIPRFLWTGSFTIKYPIKEKWELQSELIYSAKGNKINQTFKLNKNDMDISNIYKSKVLLHYIEIPLILRHKFKPKLSAILGLQSSFLLRQVTKSSSSFEYYDHSTNELIVKETFSEIKSTEINAYKRYDIGIIVGGEYAVSSSIDLGLRSIFGLNRIYRTGNNYRNLNFQIYVGYNINKK